MSGELCRVNCVGLTLLFFFCIPIDAWLLVRSRLMVGLLMVAWPSIRLDPYWIVLFVAVAYLPWFLFLYSNSRLLSNRLVYVGR